MKADAFDEFPPDKAVPANETPTAQPVVPTNPPSEFSGNRAVIGPPDAKEDVHEYSGMVHPFPNTSGNANAAQ